MGRRDAFKSDLYKGIDKYGTWCVIPSSVTINVIAKTGLDFIIIDQEHGAMDAANTQEMIISAQSEDTAAIVRVGDIDELKILYALDAGADGVIVPHVEQVKDADIAAQYSKYPPIGIRGFSPYARSGGYTNRRGYTEEENKRISVGIIVEGEQGLADISGIAAVEGIDIIYVGTYDISSVLGIPGEATNPRVLEVLESTVWKIKEAGKIPGCMFSSTAELELYDEIGLNFRVYDVDSSVLFKGFEHIKSLRLKGGTAV